MGTAQDTIVIRDPLLRGGFTVVPNILFAVEGLSHGARLLYVLLLKYAWQEGSCFPGVEQLAKQLAVERKSVRRYTRELQGCGLVTVRRRGLGQTNVYFLNRVSRRLLESQGEADGPSMGHQEVPSVGHLEGPPVGHKEYSARTKTQNGVNGVSKKGRKGGLLAGEPDTGRDPDYVAYLADQIVDVCHDEESRGFYTQVARKVPEQRIFQFLSEIKSDRSVRKPGAVFTSKIGEYLSQRESRGVTSAFSHAQHTTTGHVQTATDSAKRD